MSVFSYTRLVRVVFALLVAFSAVAIASPAAAQTEEDAKKVLALISDATKAFEAEDWATAETKFSEAYEIYPDPILLYRVGLSAEKQGRYRAALTAFEKFIAAMPDDETALKVKKRLPAVREKVPPTVKITSRPEGAEVRVGSAEGKVVGATPLETELTAGEVTLYVSAEGYEPTSRKVTLKAAEESTVDVRLVPVSTDEGGESSSLAVWGWTTLGIGAAVLATGGVFTVLTQSKVDEVNNYDKRAPGSSPGDLQDLKDQADSNYQTSLVAYGIGGAIAATGLVLIIVDAAGDDGGDATTLNLDAGVLPDRAWIGLRGNF